GVLTSRLNGLAAIAAALAGRVQLTLDPTERHGFEYQSWLGFSLFVAGATREVGRGGTYTVVHESGAEEVGVGFSVYADALAANLPSPERRRLFLPLGTPADIGEALRRDSWVTVAALSEGDTPEAQLATHVWRNGAAEPR
ncbi:ATP phosphoribosyltransferase regulatory subunit, partial [Sphingomonas bacterium]|uniref:ATP phosphoribosyltransferase regulatory subunit n=1 Tax=Sphingomonas bacterium TaxID=1895847 RepID=UPI001575BDA5